MQISGLEVPYMTKEVIERNAEALLVEYAHARGVEIRAPIPIEDIVEKHLKLGMEFDDLHRLLDVPRSGLGIDPDIFGAIWLDSGKIVIDESLDPEERPPIEGRYRFTLAHECGHWRLHRTLARTEPTSLDGDMQQPTVVCRSSEAKSRVEWQADFHASCVLMPKRLVLKAWRNELGACKPITYDQSRRESSHYRIAERFAPMFGVSTEAMRLRLKTLGLLRHKIPPREARFGETHF